MHHKIIKGGTVALGHIPLIQKEVIVANGLLLQNFMVGKGLLELLINL